MLRALRPGGRPSFGGQLLDLPFLNLIGQIRYPLRGGKAEVEPDAEPARTGFHPGEHEIRVVVPRLFPHVRHDRPGRPQITQHRLQRRPQLRTLGGGQCSWLQPSLARPPEGVGGLRP
jgi:hypothetical protein